MLESGSVLGQYAYFVGEGVILRVDQSAASLLLELGSAQFTNVDIDDSEMFVVEGDLGWTIDYTTNGFLQSSVQKVFFSGTDFNQVLADRASSVTYWSGANTTGGVLERWNGYEFGDSAATLATPNELSFGVLDAANRMLYYGYAGAQMEVYEVSAVGNP